MAHFYANENFPLPVVVHLRALGHDVKTTMDAGNHNQRIPDPDVVAYAKSEGRAVLTINRKDFVALHNGDDDHCGIVVCKQDLDFQGQAQRIHDSVTNLADLNRQLVKIKRLA